MEGSEPDERWRFMAGLELNRNAVRHAKCMM